MAIEFRCREAELVKMSRGDTQTITNLFNFRRPLLDSRSAPSAFFRDRSHQQPTDGTSFSTSTEQRA
ncbi:MAG: hypothetical protein SVT56_13365, partial [Chloroflexota bacterium]|nr:hypothetical protein [Chloroflexota bacterium]